MKKTKKYELLIIMSALSLVVAVSALIHTLRNEDKEPQRGISQPEGVSAVSVINNSQMDYEGFILQEYNGYIAIFTAEYQKNPLAVTDIQVRTLRDIDRASLRAGIRVPTHDQLVALLEDFGS